MKRILTLLLVSAVTIVNAQDETFLDLTFDQNGTKQFGGGDNYGTGILADGDKAIVSISTVGGASRTSTILRFNEDGSFDNTFDTDGQVVLLDSTHDITVNDINFIGASASFYATGYATANFDSDLFIAKIKPDGSLDITYGNNGIAIIDFGGQERSYDAVVNSSNELILAGYREQGGTRNAATFKINSLGVPEATFGTNGVSAQFNGNFVQFQHVSLDDNDNIFAIGGDGSNSAISKSDPFGDLIPGFGSGGVKIISKDADATSAEGVSLIHSNNPIDETFIAVCKQFSSAGEFSRLTKHSLISGDESTTFSQGANSINSQLKQDKDDTRAFNDFGSILIMMGATKKITLGNARAALKAIDYDFGDEQTFEKRAPSTTFSLDFGTQHITAYNQGAFDSQDRLLVVGNAIDTSTNISNTIVSRIVIGDIVSSPTGILSPEKVDFQLSVAPNPVNANTLLNLTLTETAHNVTIELLSITGQQMSIQSLTNLPAGQNSIPIKNLDQLASGQYMIKCVVDGEKSSIGLFKE